MSIKIKELNIKANITDKTEEKRSAIKENNKNDLSYESFLVKQFYANNLKNRNER